MNIKTVASEMIDHITAAEKLPDEHSEYGKDHLLDMCAAIQSGDISGDQAHRWIGWIQGCVVMGGGGTLSDMKEINYAA